MDIEQVRKAAKMMREAQEILAKGPLDFYLTDLSAAYELLMTRYAPFKIGNRVSLRETPEISVKVRPGWLGWKSVLVAGATGVVTSADCGSRGFQFGVQFDEDKAHSQKPVFIFSDSELEPR